MTTQQQVHWVQFPATALTDGDGAPVDWTDHRNAHRAVSRLFSPGLAGEAHERRNRAGILYRIDVLRTAGATSGRSSAEPTILVQSLVAPELVPTGARLMTVPARSWTFAAGDTVAFRVALNPIKRTTRRYSDTEKTLELEGVERLAAHGPRKQTARIVPADEVVSWATDKLSDALTNIEMVNHARDKTRSGSHSLVIDTFDGVAKVRDPEALDQIRVTGIGRSKAYGCGLLTTTRTSQRFDVS